jgi:hypothetical protein
MLRFVKPETERAFLQGLVQYLSAAEYGQDEREAEALAQLTDAVVAALRCRLES